MNFISVFIFIFRGLGPPFQAGDDLCVVLYAVRAAWRRAYPQARAQGEKARSLAGAMYFFKRSSDCVAGPV